MIKTKAPEFDLERGLELMLDDPAGASRAVQTMASGDLRRLPALLEPYGLDRIPREICIPIIKSIFAVIFTGFHLEVRWYRYFKRPPHGPLDFRVLLTDADIQKLKSDQIYQKNGPPMSAWDWLLAKGMLVKETVLVPDMLVVNETRQTEICKVMHGNPKA